MKYGFVGLFYYFCLWVLLLSVYHTLVQELRRHFLVFVVPFWSAFLERSSERALNFGKSGSFRIDLDRFDCSRHARVVSIKSLANFHVGPDRPDRA